MKKLNNYYIVGDITYVKYRNSYDCFIIDTNDLDKIKDLCWHDDNDYPRTNFKNKKVRLHRLIMDCPSGMVVDHINGKHWDNRKCNLRITDYRINAVNCRRMPNKSNLPTGILKLKNGKYRASLMYNYKNISLGTYDKLEDAIKARQKGEIKYFGENCPIKFKGGKVIWN